MCPINEQQRPVLVAETDPTSVRNLRECLMLLNVPARVALTEEELLSAIRHEVFSCAIVSAELRMDGEPAMAHLAALPSIRCLIVVGDDEKSEEQARLCGATLYLTRPVAAEVLAAALRQAVRASYAPDAS